MMDLFLSSTAQGDCEELQKMFFETEVSDFWCVWWSDKAILPKSTPSVGSVCCSRTSSDDRYYLNRNPPNLELLGWAEKPKDFASKMETR